MELAYTAAVKALEQQDATLGNLRNRAAGLLSAVTIATTFSASVGLFNVDPAMGMPLPDWTRWSLLGLLIAVGGLLIAVMWPVSMAFGVDAKKVLDQRHKDPTIDSVQTFLIDELVSARGLNGKKIGRKFRYFQSAVLVLIAETAVLVAALL